MEKVDCTHQPTEWVGWKGASNQYPADAADGLRAQLIGRPLGHPTPVDFEWDPEKAQRNRWLHGVSFPEAAEVFGDDLSSTVPDPDHSEGEHRYLTFGQTRSGRCLVVAYTERGGRIRLISARKMTRRERKAYEE